MSETKHEVWRVDASQGAIDICDDKGHRVAFVAGMVQGGKRTAMKRAHVLAAALDLYARLELAAAHACSLLCPSVKRTGEEWTHVPECEANRAALRKARGEDTTR